MEQRYYHATMNKLFLTILTCTFLLSCSDKNDKNNTNSCYENTSAQSIMHNGENREYLLYIPTSYDGSSAVPLLLNFHGYGGSASAFMTNADLRTLAELDNFILAYPQGSCLEGSSHWNPCPIGGDNKSDVDDVDFVESVVNEISAQYNVDTKRIYAAGYSNGAMMAFGLAHYKSEWIAAVASVSGTMLDCTSTPSHPMPVISLHGTSDGVIPYSGSNDFNSPQSVLDYWINFNNTVQNPSINEVTNGGVTIEHHKYDQGDNDVSVEHYKYVGEDHIWFHTTYQGKNASQLIWDFVSQYDINGLR